MARIDRQRLESAELPVASRIATRFSDLDRLGHVNNAVAALIMQEARSDLSQAGGLDELGLGLRYLVAALYFEFVGEMFYPGFIEVRTGVLEIGRTSATLGQIARQDGRTTIYAETVWVTADETGPVPHPPALLAMFDRVKARWP